MVKQQRMPTDMKKQQGFIPLLMLGLMAAGVGGTLLSGQSWIGPVLDWVANFAFSIVASVVLAVSYGVTAMTILYGNVLIYLGIAFGPIMLAMSVFEFFRSYFKSWLQFMMGAVMTKAAISAVIVITLPAISALADQAAAAASTNQSMGVLMLGVIILSLVAMKLIGEASSIAASLFGGLGGADASSAKNVAGAMLGTAGAAAKGATGVGTGLRGGIRGMGAAKELGQGFKGRAAGFIKGAAAGVGAGPINSGTAARDAVQKAHKINNP